MSWSNAFDLGDCTVTVYVGETQAYSGVLAKGASADFTVAGYVLNVAVSDAGVVTLNNSSDIGGETTAVCNVMVVPQYALTTMTGARLVLPLPGVAAGDASANGEDLVTANAGDAEVDLSSQSPYSVLMLSGTITGAGISPAIQFFPEWDVSAPTPSGLPTDSINCACSDTSGNRTLAQLRSALMVRLGFAAQANNPPTGMVALLNSFLTEAQELLYRRYAALRTERFYSWPLTAGVRLYDFDDNAEDCTKRIDPRKITWAGIVRDDIWMPLICGIPPEAYTYGPTAWPLRYEIRQCIEVWPAPATTEGYLVIKGHFGLERFTEDADPTTIDDRLVFLLALDNAKAHYGRPDTGRATQQMEVMLQNIVAGSHQTRRYLPGSPDRRDGVYVQPKPTVPFT